MSIKPLWHKLPAEPPLHWLAFKVYRSLQGSKRQNKEVMRLLLVDYTEKVSIQSISNWKKKFNWDARAGAYDSHRAERIDLTTDAERQDRALELYMDEYEDAQLQRGLWLKKFELIKNPTTAVGELQKLARLRNEISQLARRSLALPEKITQNDGAQATDVKVDVVFTQPEEKRTAPGDVMPVAKEVELRH